MPVTDFEEGSSWEPAVLDPLPDEVPEEDRIHAKNQRHIIAFSDVIVSFPIISLK
jgi:hypothetical protein